MDIELEILDKFIGQTLSGKYRIDKNWRESGLGKTYHGTHLSMEKPVAIKILSPALAVDVNTVNRFSAEARTVSSLSHPNVLNVTDFGSDENGMVFIVLEDAEGESLQEKIVRDGSLPVEHAVRIAQQIASALIAAHSKSVIHRHLNSSSVLLAKTTDGSEIVKVLDFGAVWSDDEGMFDEERAAAEFEYVAPEINNSQSQPDERSDIFSVGVILYEMLAGEVPYTAQTRAELVTRQTENPPRPFSAFRGDLPEELEPIVLRALANNPDMRYQKVSALAEDLAQIAKEFADGDGLLVPTSAAAAAARPGGTKNIWKTVFAVLAGILLLAATMIYATYTRQTDPATLLQADAASLPVQPLNPASGINEQNVVFYPDGAYPDASLYPGGMPDIMPGGDGRDYWANGVAPPPGAPIYPSGGPVITVEGGSQFMPNFTADGQYVLIPVPANTNPSPTPTPKGNNPPAANTQTPPKENPNPQTDVIKDPKTEKTPAVKPVEKPKKPPAADKTAKSGKEQDTN